ncbi:MTOR-associated protein MEAK7 [Punica granatum]|uniref:MTOR-associated protein MEAK7 n=1 Tax=Punica granatum TaxID=22663 RepID=A0A218XE07_PUNGR|nr:MTOR-associated protein MEAK7 [Punica granatum]OWM82562.1 hypothetical protein CDL15_Pgr002137 [Punica granatum]
MGNAQSPPADPRFTSASRAFTRKELEDLRSLFVSLALQSQSGGECISLPVFQTYFQLHGPLSERLFDLIKQKREDQKLTFEDLVIAKATYEKGTAEEIEEFVYQFLDVNGDGVLGRSDLSSVLITIFKNIFDNDLSEDHAASEQNTVRIFLDSANFSINIEGHDEKSMSLADLRSWFAVLPSVRKFLGSLLMPPDPGRPGSQVPRLSHGDNVDSSMILLKKEYAWHIGGALAEEELEEWKLLYHSSYNGLSFSTFLGNITNNHGRTVLIIKDKEGHIYGGYASQPWERHSDFYGDMKSFLFQLYPKASIYRPTGANRNLQWCAVNFSSEDIPNGIGYGGRVNHFGLFISASFDQGQTFECTTFGSPCLSTTNRISPQVIECWEVVQSTKQEKRDGVRGTVLERFKEDRHMLNMVGLANSSE